MRQGLRHRIHEIIFEADTPGGKAFDIVLILLILISVLAVMLESIEPLSSGRREILWSIEWGCTILFSIEYILRLLTVKRPLKYALSFFGIIDLISILPTYFWLLYPDSHYFIVVRILRLMRIFRVLKLAKYLDEFTGLSLAVRQSGRKIFVFFFFILNITIVFGSIMYVVEGSEHGFSSIPQSIYWAIVTLSTVGYGDISPQTVLGKIIASCIMLLGYSVIAVPTGIVMASFREEAAAGVSSQSCPHCMSEGHRPGARFCYRCGKLLD